MNRSIWIYILGLMSLAACNIRDYYRLPLYSDAHRIQAVVEVPAGTNHKVEYCVLTHRFKIQNIHDDRGKLNFLPYPFNYGFIPSTQFLEDNETGKPIDVLILAESIPTGEVLEILPVGMVTVKGEYGTRHLVVAVPCDKKKRIIDAENLKELKTKNAGVPQIIEEWLAYADQDQKPEEMTWQDEVIAQKLIETWAAN